MDGLRLMVVGLVMAVAVGCRKQDIRIARITVPQMNGKPCVERVVATIRQVPGVRGDMIEVDRQRRDVSVPYDSFKLSLKNIEYALAEVGFDANDIPADATARAALPETCR